MMIINGAFTTTLKSWVSPVTASLLSGWFGFGYDEDDVNKNTKVVLNYKFFKVNPSVLDPIFGVAADGEHDDYVWALALACYGGTVSEYMAPALFTSKGIR